MSNTKTRTAIEAGYNFHTDPHEPMISIGLVAKVAGWSVEVDENVAIENGPNEGDAATTVTFIRNYGDEFDSDPEELIRIEIVDVPGRLAHATVYAEGGLEGLRMGNLQIVGGSHNSAEIIWWILSNSPGALYPLPK